MTARPSANSGATDATAEKHTPDAIAEPQDAGGDSINDDSASTRSSKGSFAAQTQPADIVYHYLTFETALPPPIVSSSAQTHSPAPPPPNLDAFVDPFAWAPARKAFLVYLSCVATGLTSYTAGSYSPPAQAMADEWHVSKEAVLVGILTFCFGFAMAPMALAPFSEINGRYPVFAVSGILFVVCQICCAVTRSFPGMLVARFFVGCGSSVFSTMVGGVVSDMYHSKERNTPMALFSGAVLVGTGLGPLVSGVITYHLNWRYVFYVQIITCGLMVLAVILFFRETRGSVLLSRKAKAINKWYEEREEAGHVGVVMPRDDGKTEVQRIRWKVKSDDERESISKMIKISVTRPFYLLFTEPVVFFFSLWISFAWAVLYLTFSSIPLVMMTSHHFNIEQAGAVFTAMIIGSVISTITSIYQERFSARIFSAWTAKAPAHNPEQRLYFACIQSIFLPIGLFWFGWTQFESIPWIVPTMGIGCATMGIFSVYLATFNYLADTYHRFASSALAAQSCCRNLLGGVFPLVTTAMFNNLGFGPAASLLGGLAAILTIVPWVLVLYGPSIRARSKFASEIM